MVLRGLRLGNDFIGFLCWFGQETGHVSMTPWRCPVSTMDMVKGRGVARCLWQDSEMLRTSSRATSLQGFYSYFG